MADFMNTVVKTVQPYVELVKPYLEQARVEINTRCEHLEAWQIIAFTLGSTIILMWIWDFLNHPEESLTSRTKRSVFTFVKGLPIVKQRIKKEIDTAAIALSHGFNRGKDNPTEYVLQLPSKGLTEANIMVELAEYKKLVQVDWSKGSCSGTVYSGEDDLTQLMTKVFGEFAWTNPLHPDVFPDVRKMEAEVVRMVCHMFNGEPESCGTMTTGGTESIMLACKAYRDMAYERGVRYPEMVVPITAHAAFDKSAQFFRIKIIHCPVDAKTRKVDVNAMRRAVNRNTCMLVGSAPQFPHGVVDPIRELGKIAVKNNIPLHVDSCLGGFLVPFMKRAGFDVDDFDFTVPGVTSISADTHKYGFAPKGSSVILYSEKKYRQFQYFVQPDWPGGIYASPTLGGSRAGAIIAACWATMMYMGEDGYVRTTKKIVGTTRWIEAEMKKIPNIFVYGRAEVSVIGFGSLDFNIFRLSDALTEKGWNLNALQFPSSVHLCCTLCTAKLGVKERFIQDVKDCVAVIMKDPKAKCGGQGALYGMSQSIPDRNLVGDIVKLFFDAYYGTGNKRAKPVTNGKH